MPPFAVHPRTVAWSKPRPGARIIVYAWVNDEDTRRAYESTDDAYRVFRRMLESGRPPGDWDQLLAEARTEARRLTEPVARVPGEH